MIKVNASIIMGKAFIYSLGPRVKFVCISLAHLLSQLASRRRGPPSQRNGRANKATGGGGGAASPRRYIIHVNHIQITLITLSITPRRARNLIN